MAYNDGPALLVGVTALTVLAIGSVVLRFWIGRHRGMKLELDDWLIAASMVPFLGLIVCVYCSAFLAGMGKDYQINLLEDPTRPTTQIKIVYASLITIVINISLVKLSIIAMYYRIFPTRFMRWSYILVGGTIMVWTAVALPVCIFQCAPIRAAWDFQSSGGTCISAFPLYFGATGLPNVAIDLVLLCLPMYEVWKLQVPRAQKVAIVSTFLLGAVVMVADVCKLVVLVEMYDGYENREDRRAVTSLGTDKFPELIRWIVTEHALSIICANIPSLRPILTMFLCWTGLSPKLDLGRPLPKEGLVTIGGSGASGDNLVGKRCDTDNTDRPRKPTNKTYCTDDIIQSNSVSRSNSSSVKKMTDINSKITRQDWQPTTNTSEYRVVISSDPPTRTNLVWTVISTDRERYRHRDAETKPIKTGTIEAETGEGGGLGPRAQTISLSSRSSCATCVPEAPAIAVTTHTGWRGTLSCGWLCMLMPMSTRWEWV